MTKEEIASRLAAALGDSEIASGHIVTVQKELFTLSLEVSDIYSVKETVMVANCTLEDIESICEDCEHLGRAIKRTLGQLRWEHKDSILESSLGRIKVEYPGNWGWSQIRNAIALKDVDGIVIFMMSDDFGVKAFVTPEPSANIAKLESKAEMLRVKLSGFIDEQRLLMLS